MLIELCFKNFRSFKDEQTLSLVASGVRQLQENIVENETTSGLKLLKAAVVLGGNASGKSNLFAAVSFVKRMIGASVEGFGEGGIKIDPFLLDQSSAQSPSEFEISFVLEGVRYRYGFAVSRERVEEEWLYSYPHGRPRKLINRDSSKPDQKWGGASLGGEKSKIQSLTRPDALFLSVAAKFNNEQLTPIYEWFRSSLHVLYPWGRNSVPSMQYTAKRASDDGEFRSWLLTFLQSADLGVAGLELKSEAFDVSPIEVPEDEDDSEGRTKELREAMRAVTKGIVRFGEVMRDKYDAETHRAILLHAATGEPVGIPFEEESRGTQRLFQLLGPIADTLERGATLFVDEMATSLHPLLARQLVDSFNDPAINSKGAQLIINTHDPTLLDPSLFRKDQVWFTEKAGDGASNLIPLTAFKGVRSEQPFQWHYLAGRFGGVPIIGQLEPVSRD